MPWKIIPGWHREPITFEDHDEVGVARLWRVVCHFEDSSCQFIDRNGRSWGTSRGEVYRGVIDGRYHDHCQHCGKDFFGKQVNGLICIGCSVAEGPNIPPGVRVTGHPFLNVAPPPAGVGLHLAGPYDRVADHQCCIRCGALLSSLAPFRSDGQRIVPATVYPESAIVERGPTWQAINLQAMEPTCSPG